MHIALESPDQPEVVTLVTELDAYQRRLYPAESNHLMEIASLMHSHVLFAVSRDATGSANGCGAVVLTPGQGELKRMFVRPSCRGRGIARALLLFLEREAMRAGCPCLRLETGISQPEALRLYERAGYRRRGPFWPYQDDPLSVFMEKEISVDDGGVRSAAP